MCENYLFNNSLNRYEIKPPTTNHYVFGMKFPHNNCAIPLPLIKVALILNPDVKTKLSNIDECRLRVIIRNLLQRPTLLFTTSPELILTY